MNKDQAIQQAIDFLDGSYEAHAVRKALQEALEQPSNMVAVPLDKLQDMQRRLKALDKMSDNAKELGLNYD